MQDEKEKIIEEIASLTHEKFREIYKLKNNGTRIKITKDEEWIKRHGTDKVDIAKLDYFSLPKDYKKERYSGAKVAYDVLLETLENQQPLDDVFIEYASNKIHEDWLTRNMDKAEKEHKLSYNELSEEAREKDRIFVRSAIELYLNKPAKA